MLGPCRGLETHNRRGVETTAPQPEQRPLASPVAAALDFWTTEELAAHRGCKVKAIKTLREQHGLPYEEHGKGGYRYPTQAVLVWEAAREGSRAFWTTREMAARRGCAVKAIRTLREQCELPYETAPKGYVYPKQAVLAWEESRLSVDEPSPRKLRSDARTGLATSRSRRPTRRTQTFGPRPVAVSI